MLAHCAYIETACQPILCRFFSIFSLAFFSCLCIMTGRRATQAGGRAPEANTEGA
ncbi:hypothetical protein BN405_2-10_Ab1_orf_131 [Pseudomonas phage vB_PaeM_C2-10_Ab1]|uniref:Uncharacterized protein n=1 Tax=Pseudomonas phage vB_PaeM_C2-10_Ab1 TaxID=1231048 RepID=K4RME7_9CAUD|nr:hypothetical protein BN405_2-10_Ab1_orf_131 [Pseudomonas phage vB_PaeM_C2-10_Ab1]CCM43675.1 hypothetical protein BN405_2-10_Ab1_orf_131 [Pseudomonas phage vB_PaeM_C2-10_Ab1]